MTENKQKLIALVSALEEENIVDYCYTFIGLKVYGHAKLPDSITAELRQMLEKLMLRGEQKKPEQTDEEKQAGKYRCSIVRMLCDIESLDTIESIYSFIMGMLSVKKGGVKAWAR